MKRPFLTIHKKKWINGVYLSFHDPFGLLLRVCDYSGHGPTESIHFVDLKKEEERSVQ